MSSIPSMKSRNSLRKCGSSDLDNSHTSPYDRAFRQHLIDYGIYPDQYEDLDGHDMPPPENLGEIVRAMAKPRPSLSISRSTQGDFKTFEKRDSNASKKAKVINTVIPMIEEELANSQSICRQVPFSNLDHLTDGSLVSGNPDLYYGARPEQLDLRVRKQLGKQIVPSTQHDLPVVPNFFLNVKGQDGSASVAELQACYDGALGARGINSLQMYGDPELDLDNKAYTLTATYQAGTLRIYASYPRVSARPGKPHEYLTKKINAWCLTGNASTFREGVTAYRNARDWARQKRDEAIRKANDVVAQKKGSLPAPSCDGAVNSNSHPPSSYGNGNPGTDGDELVVNTPPAKRARR